MNHPDSSAALSRAARARSERLSELAQAIWWAGVAAVESARLVANCIRCDGARLTIGDWTFDTRHLKRVVVVGAGKAGGGMARGAREALASLGTSIPVTGWVNVPEGCGGPLPGIHLHEARPAGVNAPTARVVAGTREILRLVESCGPDDLCLCLISGGGSALLALPHPSITLAEQVAAIEFLASQGANIEQLNTVRKHLSQVKGGQLARACRGPMASLIISDVLGDPLEVIASGPTSQDRTTPGEAESILREFDPEQRWIAPAIHQLIRARVLAKTRADERGGQDPSLPANQRQFVIGNIQVAIDAAADFARQMGWKTWINHPRNLEGSAEAVGRQLLAPVGAAISASAAGELASYARQPCPALPDSFTRLPALESLPQDVSFPGWCWISGGEPVVRLAEPSLRGLGGRNQQLVLAAAADWQQRIRELGQEVVGNFEFCLLSGGTDGEDGPTDAAGAWLDGELMQRSAALGLDPAPYLERNDAYHFFRQTGGLLQTGPTGTNVCDLRVGLLRFALRD